MIREEFRDTATFVHLLLGLQAACDGFLAEVDAELSVAPTLDEPRRLDAFDHIVLGVAGFRSTVDRLVRSCAAEHDAEACAASEAESENDAGPTGDDTASWSGLLR